MSSTRRPYIALFSGDPAGVGPELIARLLADGTAAQCANVVLIGSREVLVDGMRTAGSRYVFDEGFPVHDREFANPLLVTWPGLEDRGFERGVVSEKGGRHMLAGLAFAIGLHRAGLVDALCFAPLNKAGLRAGGMDHPDELHWFAEVLAFKGTCVELNVLEGLWTSRVTSHVALAEVSALITAEKVAEMVELIHGSLRAAGIAAPRVAVSTRTTVTTARTAARRSTRSRPAWSWRAAADSRPTGLTRPTRSSCARRASPADTTGWSPCTTTRGRSR
jgi:4-hydroxythreonine-4-phosphate dehydrogenase